MTEEGLYSAMKIGASLYQSSNVDPLMHLSITLSRWDRRRPLRYLGIESPMISTVLFGILFLGEEVGADGVDCCSALVSQIGSEGVDEVGSRGEVVVGSEGTVEVEVG